MDLLIKDYCPACELNLNLPLFGVREGARALEIVLFRQVIHLPMIV